MSDTKVRLIPKTKKAKERVKQYGDTGIVFEVRNRIQFSQEEGPWLLVLAADPRGRWVHETNDKNFDVEYLEY